MKEPTSTCQEQVNLFSIFNRVIISIDRVVGEGMIYLDSAVLVVSKISKQLKIQEHIRLKNHSQNRYAFSLLNQNTFQRGSSWDLLYLFLFKFLINNFYCRLDSILNNWNSRSCFGRWDDVQMMERLFEINKERHMNHPEESTILGKKILNEQSKK